MNQVAAGWALTVTRGPDWLFIRLNAAPAGWWQAPPLAECLWSILQQHFTYRLVVECDEVPRLSDDLIDELIRLHERIEERGGLLRLCGLSLANQQALVECGLGAHVLPIGDRIGAAMNRRPRQPR